MSRTKIMVLSAYDSGTGTPVSFFMYGTRDLSTSSLSWETNPDYASNPDLGQTEFPITSQSGYYVFEEVKGDRYLTFDLSMIFNDFSEVAQITIEPNGKNLMISASNTDSLISFGSYVFFYDYASFSSFAGGGSVDLNPVLTAIANVQNRVNLIPDETIFSAYVSGAVSTINSFHLDHTPSVDLTPVIDLLTPLQIAELNNLHEDILSLGTQLSTVTVPLQSLNGNGSEYKDGVQVLVTGRLPVYTVSRSYMSMMDTDTYTCVYDLEAPDGSKTTCPESFLTPYVTPVVTP